MNIDKGTEAERPLRTNPIALAVVAVTVAMLVALIVARSLGAGPGEHELGQAPAATATPSPSPEPAPGHDHHPDGEGPPPEAWQVAVMFLDGIRTTHAEERGRILRSAATEDYRERVANVAEWNLPRGTIESIEPVAGHTFRVVLRAENRHGGGWSSQPWFVTVVTDPFSPLQWRVAQLAQDHK